MNGLFLENLFTNPVHFASWIVLVVFSICVHEYAHASTALRLGDDTAALLGHLTLNPMKQMGAFSLVMLAVAGIAWGQVPVNRQRLRGHRHGEALVAAAGPVSNLALAALFLILFLLFARLPLDPERLAPVLHFFSVGAFLNVFLMLFNLVPVPPLDGWQIASAYIPAARNINPMTLAQVANIAIIVLLVSGIGGKIQAYSLAGIMTLLPEQDATRFLFAFIHR